MSFNKNKLHQEWFGALRLNDVNHIQSLLKQGQNPKAELNRQTACQIVQGYITKLNRMAYKDHVRICLYSKIYHMLLDAEQKCVPIKATF